MWTYISKNGTKYAIPYSNIDYVVLSVGEFIDEQQFSIPLSNNNYAVLTIENKNYSNSKTKIYYHSKIKKYSKDEVLTILYRKDGNYNLFAGEVPFNQLVITPEYRFTSQKD
jgi:hypothetical protein